MCVMQRSQQNAPVFVDVSRFMCVMKPSAFHLRRTILLISVVIRTGNNVVKLQEGKSGEKLGRGVKEKRERKST